MGIVAISQSCRTVPDQHALQDDALGRPHVPRCDLPSIAPSWIHQRCIAELLKVLEPFVEESGIGVVLSAPAEVVPDCGTAIQPDVSVIGLVDGRISSRWRSHDLLLLAAEVLSPATARSDRVEKRAAYLRMNAVYWIVDPDARVVERWLPCGSRPDVLDDEVFWFPAGASEPLVIDLESYFQRVFKYFHR